MADEDTRKHTEKQIGLMAALCVSARTKIEREALEHHAAQP